MRIWLDPDSGSGVDDALAPASVPRYPVLGLVGGSTALRDHLTRALIGAP